MTQIRDILTQSIDCMRCSRIVRQVCKFKNAVLASGLIFRYPHLLFPLNFLLLWFEDKSKSLICNHGAGRGDSQRKNVFYTSDERETFLQSNFCEPLADFICVQLPERFGLLPVNGLRRRSGYIPAAYTTTYLGKTPVYNVLYHYVMVLYTQATYVRTYIPAVHTKHYFEIWYSMYMYFFSNVLNPEKKKGNCWELQRAWDMTHKDDSDSNCFVWKLISWEAKQRLQDNLVKLISTLSLSASLIHAKSGHDCVGYPSFDILQQVITFVCLAVNKCLKRTKKSLLQMWTETQVSM